MSSALRLGLSGPAAAAAAAAAAAGASHLLRPLPASHAARSATPTIAPLRAFSTTPALFKKPNSEPNASKKSGHVAWEPTKLKIKRDGLPNQGIPLDAPDLPIPKPYARDPHIPAYPYGPRLVYKQSNYGLYGAARIRFGNNVSEKHNVKTKRVWRPNVQRKRLWSFKLGCWVQTRLTMRVLRTIDKVGGLDNYVLGNKPARLKELGPWGWKLRWRIMQSGLVADTSEEERAALGLPEGGSDEALGMEGPSEGSEQEALDSPTGPVLIADSTAEAERMTTLGPEILALEGMNIEPEAAQDETVSSYKKEDSSLGAEVARDNDSSPRQNKNANYVPEVAEDEGFMKEARP